MGGFLLRAILRRDEIANFDAYPFNIPCVKNLRELPLHPSMTYFVGENGSGKSTLIEGLAVAAGFNAEGGSKSFNFRTSDRPTESCLSDYLTLVRGGDREKWGFFLRAESFFNVATNINELGVSGYYGGSLHAKSHGESFMALLQNRFEPNSLLIFDEPEAALSPARQIVFLKMLIQFIEERNCQILMATHSPILMAYPDSTMYFCGPDGLAKTTWQETDH